MSHYREWTEEEVWQRVCRFAEDAQAAGQPLYTLTHRVRNRITEVRADTIVRQSDRGRSHGNQPTRADVCKVWKVLLATGYAGRRAGRTVPNGVPSVTFALLLAAMGDILEDVGRGQIALKRHGDGGRAGPEAVDNQASGPGVPKGHARQAGLTKPERGEGSETDAKHWP